MNTKYKIYPKLEFSKIGKESISLNLDDGLYKQLNESATDILELLLNGAKTKEEICKGLELKYKSKDKVISEDIDIFIEKAIAEKLIVNV